MSRVQTFEQFRLAAVVLNRIAIALCLLLLLARVGSAADVTPHNVLAHADGERFWVARVDQTPGVPNSTHTTIYFRLFGQDEKWQPLTREVIPARVVGLASQNSLAAALLDDGGWMLLYGDGLPVSAGSLPEPARMVALSGGPGAWWAVGVVPGGIAGLATPATTQSAFPSTRSTSTTQVATTRPQTQPAADRLVIFWLSGNDWKPKTELADSVSEAPSVSLTFVSDVPYVADLDHSGILRVRHLEGGDWKQDAALPAPKQLAGFQLLSNSSTPRLWVQEQSGPDHLYAFPKSGETSIALAPIPGSLASDRTLAIAFERIRMIAAVAGKLVEQDFKLDGTPDGTVAPLAVPQASPLVYLERLQSIIVTLALIVAIFGSFRQRSAMRGSTLKLTEITLAPLGRRLAAGLIDAAPAILGAAAAIARFYRTHGVSQQNQSLQLMVIYWCAGIFYVVYVTVIESTSGRSLGKLLMGLRVIGLDGQPAKPGALVTRNVLRVIEVGLGFLPVLMVLLFPLRQRAGDVAAGTLVVTAESGAPTQDEKVQETSQSTQDKP
jgi:uncharacterized RDD family membrane protein YckC